MSGAVGRRDAPSVRTCRVEMCGVFFLAVTLAQDAAEK